MHRLLPMALINAGVHAADFAVGNPSNSFVLDLRRHYDRGIACFLLEWNRAMRKRLSVHGCLAYAIIDCMHLISHGSSNYFQLLRSAQHIVSMCNMYALFSNFHLENWQGFDSNCITVVSTRLDIHLWFVHCAIMLTSY